MYKMATTLDELVDGDTVEIGKKEIEKDESGNLLVYKAKKPKGKTYTRGGLIAKRAFHQAIVDECDEYLADADSVGVE
jgi:hypothetical protein